MSHDPRLPWPTDAELDDLVQRFQTCTLLKHEWTHAAHMAVGTWHVAHFGTDETLTRLRSAIQLLNVSLGGVNDDANGYHETITRAYVTLIAGQAADGSAAAVRRVLGGPLAAKDVLLRFYSKDRLMSVAARRGWVEPDLMPLDVPFDMPRDRAELTPAD